MGKRWHCGISTIELLIVLAISALLLCAAIPLLKPILQEAELRSEARILAESVEELSITAQLRGERILMAVENAGFHAHRHGIENAPFLSRSFQHSIVATRPQTITMYPSGVVSPATIVLQRENRRCDLTVALRGRVNVKTN